MLKIKDLHVEVAGKPILKGISLEIKKGETHVLMGENGSGKSTLSLVLMGHPRYKITEGEILFGGKNILDLEVDERAKLGMFLLMQNPPEIEGIRFARFLMESHKNFDTEIGKINVLEFNNKIKESAKEQGFDSELLNRSVNLGLSGGEKKKAEMFQFQLLNEKMKLGILDEFDSGLDVDALKKNSEVINNFNKDKDKSLLLITHYSRILDFIETDFVHVMIDGKIVLTGGKEVADQIERQGYLVVKEKK